MLNNITYKWINIIHLDYVRFQKKIIKIGPFDLKLDATNKNTYTQLVNIKTSVLFRQLKQNSFLKYAFLAIKFQFTTFSL